MKKDLRTNYLKSDSEAFAGCTGAVWNTVTYLDIGRYRDVFLHTYSVIIPEVFWVIWLINLVNLNVVAAKITCKIN